MAIKLSVTPFQMERARPLRHAHIRCQRTAPLYALRQSPPHALATRLLILQAVMITLIAKDGVVVLAMNY
jgi:hypothetical protein